MKGLRNVSHGRNQTLRKPHRRESRAAPRIAERSKAGGSALGRDYRVSASSRFRPRSNHDSRRGSASLGSGSGSGGSGSAVGWGVSSSGIRYSPFSTVSVSRGSGWVGSGSGIGGVPPGEPCGGSVGAVSGAVSSAITTVLSRRAVAGESHSVSVLGVFADVDESRVGVRRERLRWHRLRCRGGFSLHRVALRDRRLVCHHS